MYCTTSQNVWYRIVTESRSLTRTQTQVSHHRYITTLQHTQFCASVFYRCKKPLRWQYLGISGRYLNDNLVWLLTTHALMSPSCVFPCPTFRQLAVGAGNADYRDSGKHAVKAGAVTIPCPLKSLVRFSVWHNGSFLNIPSLNFTLCPLGHTERCFLSKKGLEIPMQGLAWMRENSAWISATSVISRVWCSFPTNANVLLIVLIPCITLVLPNSTVSKGK